MLTSQHLLSIWFPASYLHIARYYCISNSPRQRQFQAEQRACLEDGTREPKQGHRAFPARLKKNIFNMSDLRLFSHP